MATVHGVKTKIVMSGYDLSAFFKSAKPSREGSAAEVTTFQAAAKLFIPGIQDGKISLSGLFDPTAITGSDVILKAALNAADSQLIYLPNGDAVGNRSCAFDFTEVKYDLDSPINGAVAVAVEGQSNVGGEGGLVLHGLTNETATITTAVQDGGASNAPSTNGASAYLQCTAFTGLTSLVATIQDSADNVFFATIMTFATITGPQAYQRLLITGNVRRYIRAVYTIVGTGSCTAITVFNRK